jgi:hypothetical protein
MSIYVGNLSYEVTEEFRFQLTVKLVALVGWVLWRWNQKLRKRQPERSLMERSG